MKETDKLNMRLRSYVLEHSIRQERTSSNIIKSLLRILKDKTKTLGNKSSNLSFKNKIDLLHDLGDIDDAMYIHLTKFMEIRNQFAHNPDCSSFLKLGEANPELTKHLKNKFKNEEKIEEQSLLLSYNELFKVCQTKLLVVEHEYNVGLELDFQKYVNHEVCQRMETILNEAIGDWNEFNNSTGYAKIPAPLQSHIDHFIISFQKVLSTHRVNIFDELTDNYEKAFKRKVSIEELSKFRKKEKENHNPIESAKPKNPDEK